MHYLFIPSSFAASSQQPSALLWYMPLHFHPSLYNGRSVSPVGMGLFSGFGREGINDLLADGHEVDDDGFPNPENKPIPTGDTDRPLYKEGWNGVVYTIGGQKAVD